MLLDRKINYFRILSTELLINISHIMADYIKCSCKGYDEYEFMLRLADKFEKCRTVESQQSTMCLHRFSLVPYTK